MIGHGPPGQFIRFHAERAMDRLGIDYVGFPSWVDTGKIASRLKYGRLSIYVSDGDFIKLRKNFQQGLPRYRTEVYRVMGYDSAIAFKIYKNKKD